VEIPANTTATVYIPAANAEAVTESGKSLSAGNIKTTGTESGYVVVELGSGKYHFVVKK
jgi:alpha-L-rhamnosidase